MNVTMHDSIKRWTAKRKTALVVEIIPAACLRGSLNTTLIERQVGLARFLR